MAREPYSSGDTYRADFPRINAMGVRPMRMAEGYDSRKGPLGAPRPVSIIATGRFGGSRDMKMGADRNPLSSGRGRSGR